MNFDLAQVNIARLAADLGSLQLRDFVDALDPINAEADLADGPCASGSGETAVM